jgi:hypothetical protein
MSHSSAPPNYRVMSGTPFAILSAPFALCSRPPPFECCARCDTESQHYDLVTHHEQ